MNLYIIVFIGVLRFPIGKVQASYGTPDYIFVGSITPEIIDDTDELKGLEFIDIRKLEVGGLSAGHDVIVLRYREMLDRGQDTIPDSALENFDQARQSLAC